MKKTTLSTLKQCKADGRKFASITAYDASFAQIFEQEGLSVMLVGDSLGMVLQGNSDTIPVTVEHMAYHIRSVRAGAPNSLVIGDMPFMSYATPEQTYQTAAALMQAGANMVKLEGGEWLSESIRGLTERGIPVCGHLGLTPQSVHLFGGYKVQGRSDEKANEMLAAAKALEASGAQLLVLECIPSALAKLISEQLDIPVIGIGAGVETDGQILVMHDILGISAGGMPKFSKNFLAETGDIRTAVRTFIADVEQERFPAAEHSFE